MLRDIVSVAYNVTKAPPAPVTWDIHENFRGCSSKRSQNHYGFSGPFKQIKFFYYLNHKIGRISVLGQRVEATPDLLQWKRYIKSNVA
jgi:hypothetical protein